MGSFSHQPELDRLRRPGPAPGSAKRVGYSVRHANAAHGKVIALSQIARTRSVLPRVGCKHPVPPRVSGPFPAASPTNKERGSALQGNDPNLMPKRSQRISKLGNSSTLLKLNHACTPRIGGACCRDMAIVEGCGRISPCQKLYDRLGHVVHYFPCAR